MKTSLLSSAFLLAGLFHFSSLSAQWVQQNNPSTAQLESICFRDANHGYAFSVQGPEPIVFTLLETSNGGATWTNSSLPGTSFAPFSMYFVDANTGFAGGVDVIYRTTNGGASWTGVSLPNTGPSKAVFSVYFYNATIGYACGFDYVNNLTYMLHTSDGGLSWASVAGGTSGTLGGHNFHAIDANTCFVVGFNGSNPGAYKTTDGGASWTFLSNPESTDLRDVWALSATTLFASGGGAGIMKSTDGGLSWTQVIDNSLASDILAMQFFDANTAVAVGGENILRTLNGGLTWEPMTTPNISEMGLRAVHFPTANTGYACGDNGVILKYNGTVDVSEQSEQNSFTVYPNPSNGRFEIRANESMDVVEIFNLTGQCVQTVRPNAPQVEINTEGQLAGVYFYNIKFADGKVQSGRIIIE